MQQGRVIRFKTRLVDSGDGMSALEYGRVTVECSYTRTYHSALPILALLPVSARNLLDYLCSVMTDGNLVFSNRSMRDAFVHRMAEAGVRMSDGSVQRAFQELADARMILRVKRGVYRVNPEYFMKNKAQNREQLIRASYENDKKA